MLDRVSLAATDRRAMPTCPDHPDSLVRRYRAHGTDGRAVYPQCVPRDGQAHFLAWPDDASLAVAGGRFVDLSASELTVLTLAADGFTTTESAKILRKSTETVKTQRRQVLMKLGARNMTQAVGFAVHRALIPRPEGA